MERGYWQPPNADFLPACKGFFVTGKAVYTGPNIETDWERFLELLSSNLPRYIPSLKKVGKWQHKGVGQSRFVLLSDEYADIVVEDIDEYIAVFALIPEDCHHVKAATDRFFQYVSALRRLLTYAYPSCVFQRINSQIIRPIT